MIDTSPILECITCPGRFSEQDVVQLRYFPQARRCMECLKKDRESKRTCFGKQTKGSLLGYSTLAIECKEMCPDRKLCPQFANGSIDVRFQLTQEACNNALKLLHKDGASKRRRKAHPFRSGSMIYDAFEMCREGSSKKELQTYFNRRGGDWKRVVRLFRREMFKGYEWDWVEREGKFRLIFPKE